MQNAQLRKGPSNCLGTRVPQAKSTGGVSVSKYGYSYIKPW
jgi:hypothetical protein